MSRPLGACGSCGITRSTKSPAPTRSPRMVCWVKSDGILRSIATRSSSISKHSFALVTIGATPSSSVTLDFRVSISERISLLLIIVMSGIFCFLNLLTQLCSISKSPSSQSRIAISVRSLAISARSTRCSPSLPSSSKPGVSIKRQAPISWSSIALRTESVVVPAESDTIDAFCEVIALKSVDLPLLRRPKIEICNLFELGV